MTSLFEEQWLVQEGVDELVLKISTDHLVLLCGLDIAFALSKGK